MNSVDIKKQAEKNGARLCGIAPIDRFTAAPKGFGPLDLFPHTKSVIAFAKQIPKSTLRLPTLIPYSVSEEIALFETHRIALELSLVIEAHGYQAVMVPSEPYEYWDEMGKTGKGLISLKHLAHQCGLGTWGRNHLIYNPEIGSLMKIGAVLTDAKLEPDPVLDAEICNDKCRLCFSSCPAGALSKSGVDQLKCRNRCEGKTKKGYPIYSCNICRNVCPNVFGFK